MKFEFENIYQQFNAVFFKSQLKHPKFLFDPSKKFPMRWINGQFIIGGEILVYSVLESVVNILHEMIHVCNHQQSKIDLGINQYHNKEFLSIALDLGFYVIKHKRQGWSLLSLMQPRSITNISNVKSPTATANKKLREALDCIMQQRGALIKDFKMFSQQIANVEPPKPFLLKYECNCPAPHNSIRSGRRPIAGTNAHPSAMCKTCRSDYMCTSRFANFSTD